MNQIKQPKKNQHKLKRKKQSFHPYWLRVSFRKYLMKESESTVFLMRWKKKIL